LASIAPIIIILTMYYTGREAGSFKFAAK